MKKIKLLIISLLLSLFSSFVLADSKVLLQTSMGDIVIELDSEHAPITTKNFLDYVNSGYYENLTFHRVIPGFMIQATSIADSG